MEFYNVRICKFTKIENYTVTKRLIVDKYENRICVLVNFPEVAKDIKTGETFYILKKDYKGRILARESSKINMNDKYVTAIEKLDDLSFVEKAKLEYTYLKLQTEEYIADIKEKQKKLKRW